MYCIGFYIIIIMIIIIVKEYVVLKQGIRQGRGTAFETVIVFYAWSLQSFKQIFARTYFYHLYMEMFLHIFCCMLIKFLKYFIYLEIYIHI